jgi:hypothetical protein
MFDKICSYKNLSFFVLCFLMNILSTFAQAGLPELSPAGGNYLVIDGKDDYAFLDFDKVNVLIKKGTSKFTVEAWIYPISVPENEVSVVLSQQVCFQLVNYNNPDYQETKKNMKEHNIDWKKDDFLLMMWAYEYVADAPNAFFSTGFWPMTISPNKWHHIAFQAQDGESIRICDNFSYTVPQGLTIQHDLSTLAFEEQKDFVLGGYGHTIISQQPAYRWGSFTGYIDEVRISDIPRYDVKGELIPKWKFTPDANTIALWHFDEPYTAKKFRDSSINGYDLTGMNDVKVGPFAVDEHNKLTTTWGRIRNF